MQLFTKLNYILYADGPALPQEEVISSSNVQPSVQVHCNILCHKEPNCVGFNFRRESKTENCQLTYTAKGMTNTGSGDWTLFMAADVVCKAVALDNLVADN